VLNILIPTKPDDSHAVYAQLALEKIGHQCILWQTADFPVQQTHSFELLEENFSWSAKGTDFEINNDKVDVVWLRRPRKPTLPEFIHPEDRENAQKENAMLYQTFWQVIAPEAMWINSPNKARVANSKLLQLKTAIKLGLKIPTTLISNDAKRIRSFIQNAKDDSIIYKTLYPMYWFGDREMRLTYTKEIKIKDLPSDAVLQSTPGIFQRKINKAFELRVTYFGAHGIAVKIRSQEHPRGLMDWRYVPTAEIRLEEYKLPPEIDQKCQALMKSLGLVFGCFDFIVTPNNEYYFLEINEQGQFLWIEEVNPEIKMLEPFVDFVISKDRNFSGGKSLNLLALSDFQKEADVRIRRALEVHKNIELM
jgi:glutathione synthase/RimK-type ligase-like ATP-grasp enzyme